MFQDTGETIYSFFYNYDKLIECPECLHCITLKKDSAIIICYKCGYQSSLNSIDLFTSLWGRNEGTAYGYNLFLRTPVCGHELWVLNKEHLDYLEGYISSTNRRRIPNINQSVASRIPDWMKSSKNRLQVINALTKLRFKLEKL
ncbi:hypothetical protein ACFO9Q_10950 [Paenibacillus sp. GCM10023252]|uniref:hypothetical protein n=1 Tax=Paenibacillus sp. GCM10023252 TaxID=3252649 RepID=UPI00360FD3E5